MTITGRLLVVIGLLALAVVPIAMPRAAAGEPGSTPFLSVSVLPSPPRKIAVVLSGEGAVVVPSRQSAFP